MYKACQAARTDGVLFTYTGIILSHKEIEAICIAICMCCFLFFFLVFYLIFVCTLFHVLACSLKFCLAELYFAGIDCYIDFAIGPGLCQRHV